MAFRGIALSAVAMSSVPIFRMAAQFLVVPMLSRLLSPADYGLVSMAMPFLLFTMMFTDAGVGQSLMRTPRSDEEVWTTSFWLTIILGVTLCLGIIALAPAAAHFFGEPRLKPLIMALALAVIPQAAATIPEASLRQNHRFGVIAATESAAHAIGIMLALLIAWQGGGAWALIAQQLGLYGARFVLTFWYSTLRPGLVFNLRSVREHLIFGRNVLGASFMTTLTQSVDSFVIGKVLGSLLLGYYAMAFIFVRLPWRVVTGPLEYVIYAHLAPLAGNKDLVRRVFLLLTRVLAILVVPAIGLVAAAHTPVFRILLSDKWQLSGILFMVAAPAAALQTVTAFYGTFIMALGRTDVQVRLNTEFLVALAIALLLCAPHGIVWAVMGYSAVVFLYFPRYLALIMPLLGCPAAAYLRTLAVPVVMTLSCVALYIELTYTMVTGDWQQMFLGGALALLGIVSSALIQYRALFGEVELLSEAAGFASA